MTTSQVPTGTEVTAPLTRRQGTVLVSVAVTVLMVATLVLHGHRDLHVGVGLAVGVLVVLHLRGHGGGVGPVSGMLAHPLGWLRLLSIGVAVLSGVVVWLAPESDVTIHACSAVVAVVLALVHALRPRRRRAPGH